MLWLFAWHWQQLLAALLIMIYLLKSLVDLGEKTGSGRFKANMLGKMAGTRALRHLPGMDHHRAGRQRNGDAGCISLEWLWRAGNILTIAVIGAGVAVAAYMLWRQHNIFHGLAVAWALFGIWPKRSGAADAPEVATAALAGMGIVLLLSAWRSGKWLSY